MPEVSRKRSRVSMVSRFLYSATIVSMYTLSPTAPDRMTLFGELFVTSDEDSTLNINEVRISIKYDILPYNGSDQLIITSTMTN